jgi:predicted solute-binding protein
LDYYQNAIVYTLGAAEWSGLELFLKLAQEYGLVKSGS